MIKICLSGACGHMGRMLLQLIKQEANLSLASALERSGHPELGARMSEAALLIDDAQAAIAAADVLLEFGSLDGALLHAQIAAQLGKAVVIGTTGFSAEQQDTLRKVARRVPLLWSSNMSQGVHLARSLVEQAARTLVDYDAEILEIHHRRKADAPSGTALLLAEDIARARQGAKKIYGRTGKRQEGEIGMAAVRGGDVVGEHQVMFLAPGEQIIITHRATSREHFCRGALLAVRFVFGRAAGWYSMADVFKEG